MEADEARDRLGGERERLETVRSELLETGLGTESEEASLSELSSVDQHQADVGTETFGRERDLSLLEQVEAELDDVTRALSSLDDGTYGRCEACGRPIEESRLEARPEARFCLADQQTAEREARTPRPPASP